MMLANERLESQVVRPRLRPLDVAAQIERILSPQGWRVELSDKGIYRDQSAELFGGLDGLIRAVLDPAWHAALLAYSAAKQSGSPGRWLKSESRRVLTLQHVLEIQHTSGLEASPADLVARGILRRGLLNKCSRCRWEGWYQHDELGDTLRCGRCRKIISLDEPGWQGEGEPAWYYRLDEVLWQFCEHNGQAPLRAAREHLWRERPTTLIGPELDLYEPGRTKPTEIDICVIRGGALWIGEARTASSLGRNDADARAKLARLRQAAAALNADGILLASEPGFTATARTAIDAVFPSGQRWRVSVVRCPAPSR
jgi:hypothetical protein